jgi:predicted acyltransferase (DUF342 family)
MAGGARPTALVHRAYVFAFASPAWAIETRTGDDVLIRADEVVDDELYVGANTVTVQGTIEGDLVAAGATIRVDGGTVEGDVDAGQTILIDGTVEDDVRVAGQAMVLGENARITDDLIAFGCSLESSSDFVVGGDLALGGYQALLAGTIEGNVRSSSGAAEAPSPGRLTGWSFPAG